MRRRWSLTVGAVAIAIGLPACSAGDPEATGESGTSVTVRLVIADEMIREPGVSCQGAGGYRYAHPGASFVVEDDGGQPVAQGVLPGGTAERIWNIELGEVPREPTNCVMMLEIPELDEVDGLSLVIGDRPPRPIRTGAGTGEVPEVVLS